MSQRSWPDIQSVRAAAERIQPWVRQTPLGRWEALDEAIGHPVLLKCENQQEVSAFKSRGACNAVMSLDGDLAARGVATHSSGNHAAALARAAHIRDIDCHVVMPRGAAVPKRQAAEQWGAHIIDCEATMADRIQTLERVMAEHGAELIHPYEDSRVMSGQGTVALELLDALEEADTVFVPLGGGGLISGMAVVLAAERPSIRLVGVEPAGADDARRSFEAGSVVPVTPDTIADGLRATIGEINLEIIRHHVDAIVTVEDQKILDAMGLIWRHAGMKVEPSAAVSLAAARAVGCRPEGRAVCILTGGNVLESQFDCW